MMILRMLLVFPISERNFRVTSDGRGGGMPHPKRSSSLSREWGELLFQTKFLAVSTSLGHLFMKNFFRLELPSCP